MRLKWEILIRFEKEVMEYWSKECPRAMSVEGINFKGVVLNDWNNYGNELLRIAFSVPCNDCIKIFKI
jgi:hypothetical protein